MAAEMNETQFAHIRKYLSENFQDLSSVYAAHKKSFTSCEEEVNQWKKFIEDYNTLEKALSKYPDKTSYEEPIPIGTLAYMEGRKIHTNEVLVHLGENWFAERSVKDAIDICRRRKELCIEKLKLAEESQKLHENWMKQTEDLAREKDAVDILEQVTEEEYERDKEKHKEMLARHVALSKGTSETSEECSVKSEMKTFEDLLKRLDILEDEERLEDEKIESGELEEDVDTSEVDPVGSGKLKRRVSWANNLVTSTAEEEATSPDNPEDETTSLENPEDASEQKMEVDEERVDHETLKIRYRSRQQSLPVELMGVVEKEEHSKTSEGDKDTDMSPQTPQSPSDLYKLIVGTHISDPPAKGILKKKRDSLPTEADLAKGVGWSEKNDTVMYSPNSPDEEEEDLPKRTMPLSESPREIKNLKPAFTYKIVAREGAADDSSPSSAEIDPSSSSAEEPRKVSRFKAARFSQDVHPS